ncbi:MAG: glycosyltransferase family 39 protein [Chthonomonadales bacterium]|nr:glycosyltransferase family 39 protein [Chthonomonadales bacterium]
MIRRPWRPNPILYLVALCFVGFWYAPSTLGITDLDEGLYAACARDMARTGDWITPRVNGEPFYEKPPLLYWLSAASIKLLGPTERAVRLPSGIAATALVIITYLFGLKYIGRRAAFIAGAALALAPMTAAAGRLATTDAALCLLLSGCLYSSYLSVRSDTTGRTYWSLAAWVCAAFGTLAKGAPAIVIPVAILGLHYLVVRRARPVGQQRRRLLISTLVGLGLFVVIVAPWHVAVWRANGQPFVDEYIVRQHIGRFRGGDTAHHAPLWFYGPAFLAGFFPWSVVALAGLFARRPSLNAAGPSISEPPPDQDVLTFLRLWFGVVFVIFSAGGSKLVSYILPLYPAAALLAGHWLARATMPESRARPLIVTGIAGAAIVGSLFACLLFPAPVIEVVNRYADRPVRLSSVDAEWLNLAAAMAGVLTAGLGAMAGLAMARRVRLVPNALILTMLAFFLVALHLGLPTAQRAMIGSLHAVTRRAAAVAGDRGALIIALPGPRRPSVLYYLPDAMLARRAVVEIDAQDGTVGSAVALLRSRHVVSDRLVAIVSASAARPSDIDQCQPTVIAQAGPYLITSLFAPPHGGQP